MRVRIVRYSQRRRGETRSQDGSDWKTYPQLYVAGKLIGGHDIVVELAEDDELKDVVCVKPPAPPVSLDERIKGIIASGEVVLFMKGVPDEPRCGFSRRMVSLLQDHKIQFKSFDILQDNEVRQRLKTYSNWPSNIREEKLDRRP